MRRQGLRQTFGHNFPLVELDTATERDTFHSVPKNLEPLLTFRIGNPAGALHGFWKDGPFGHSGEKDG
jgi:hypothetical protein